MSKEENPDRPLTEDGVRTVQQVANLLRKAGVVSPSEVRHSGKLRARQTAEKLVETLALDSAPEEARNLGPTDDVSKVASELETSQQDLMLVGHLPHLDRLASLLVCDDADARSFDFQQGGVLCLQRNGRSSDADGWRVRWMLVPELVAS
jgi:phosphohistidine phosphatase